MSENNRLVQEAEIIRRVMDHMSWIQDKAELWYSLKNPLFGGASPKQLVDMDRGHKVLEFIDQAEDNERRS